MKKVIPAIEIDMKARTIKKNYLEQINLFEKKKDEKKACYRTSGKQL